MHHRGYILLTTMLLIPVIAVTTISIARRSLQTAVRTVDAEAQLQHRWAVFSLNRSLLPQAPDHFEQTKNSTGPGETDDPEKPPVIDEATLKKEPPANDAQAIIQYELTLSNHTYTLYLADEQAKLNVNVLYDQLGHDKMASAIESLLEAADTNLDIQLQPYKRHVDEKTQVRSFATFTQLLPSAPPAALIGDDISSAPATILTCWSNGKMNVKRTSAEALSTLVGSVLSEAETQRLVQAREQQDDADLDQILNKLAITESKRETLERLLTDTSTCYSLWITYHTEHRRHDTFCVRDLNEDSISNYGFSWQ